MTFPFLRQQVFSPRKFFNALKGRSENVPQFANPLRTFDKCGPDFRPGLSV